MDHGGISHARRRSVDVGGLALALGNQGLGHGWGGWEEREKGEIRYAELLSEMYTQTETTINSHFIQLPPFDMPADIRQRLITSLDSWNFEPHRLPDEEVLCCTLLLFEVLFRIQGMAEDIGISLSQISGFLRHLRTIYRWQNSYHNFQHALDVLQATQMFLCAAGRVPPMTILLQGDERSWRPDKTAGSELLIDCMDNLDIFTLYIAAIGHDVGHPGFTNVFMKNAKTPLSFIYGDESALEKMHYALLLKVMKHNGLGELLDRCQSGIRVRKLLSAVVLATDMKVHDEFMKNFCLLVDGVSPLPADHTTLVCQALIKCADISNPSRPHAVSQHWASALSEEWSSQMQLEEHFHLPSTVKPSTNPLGEAKSQIFFINKFAKPLLDITARAIPQLRQFADQCTANLQIWEARQSEIEAEAPQEVSSKSQHRLPEDVFTVFPMTLPPIHLIGPGGLADPPGSYLRSETSSASSHYSESSYLRSDADIHAHSSAPSNSFTYVPGSPGFPSPSESARSEQLFSYTLQRPPSAASISTTGSSDATSIRAAYQAGVRKKRSMNRNSWNPMSPTHSPVTVSPLPQE